MLIDSLVPVLVGAGLAELLRRKREAERRKAPVPAGRGKSRS